MSQKLVIFPPTLPSEDQSGQPLPRCCSPGCFSSSSCRRSSVLHSSRSTGYLLSRWRWWRSWKHRKALAGETVPIPHLPHPPAVQLSHRPHRLTIPDRKPFLLAGLVRRQLTYWGEIRAFIVILGCQQSQGYKSQEGESWKITKCRAKYTLLKMFSAEKTILKTSPAFGL